MSDFKTSSPPQSRLSLIYRATAPRHSSAGKPLVIVDAESFPEKVQEAFRQDIQDHFPTMTPHMVQAAVTGALAELGLTPARIKPENVLRIREKFYELRGDPPSSTTKEGKDGIPMAEVVQPAKNVGPSGGAVGRTKAGRAPSGAQKGSALDRWPEEFRRVEAEFASRNCSTAHLDTRGALLGRLLDEEIKNALPGYDRFLIVWARSRVLEIAAPIPRRAEPERDRINMIERTVKDVTQWVKSKFESDIKVHRHKLFNLNPSDQTNEKKLNNHWKAHRNIVALERLIFQDNDATAKRAIPLIQEAMELVLYQRRQFSYGKEAFNRCFGFDGVATLDPDLKLTTREQLEKIVGRIYG